MSTLNGRDITTTWKDLLRFENAGEGLPADGNTLTQVEDGNGNLVPVSLSRTKFNIISGFMLGGVAVSATATQLNALVAHLTAINGNDVVIRVKSTDSLSIPETLAEGELHINQDTGEFSYGDDMEAVQPLKVNGANILGTVPKERLPADVALRGGVLQTNLNAEKWNGHKVLVQTTEPTGGTGDDGDFCFVYTP